MDFQRNSNGMLGFGIDESGVVRKVDGLAKTTGLQVHSRILQVYSDAHLLLYTFMYALKGSLLDNIK